MRLDLDFKFAVSIIYVFGSTRTGVIVCVIIRMLVGVWWGKVGMGRGGW